MDTPAPAPVATPTPLQPGAMVDRYRIVRQVGRGAMGTIHLAHDTVLDRQVALKVLPDTLRARPEHWERFLREAQAAAKIRHPNVVAIHDVCLSVPPYIVMEYLEGETFEAFLRREAPMALDQALAVLLPVVSALMAVHETGVVHRDLKPSNIMLVRERDGSFSPKVLDFGISKLQLTVREPRGVAPQALELTAHDALLGTPNYMAPEQDGSQGDVGPWSDTYALALTLYRAVTGRLPFSGANAQEVLYRKRCGTFVPLATFPFGLPEGLDRWMQRALHPDPQKRFRSMQELGVELLPFVSEPQRARWENIFVPSEAPEPFAQGSFAQLPAPPLPPRLPGEGTASITVDFTATRSVSSPVSRALRASRWPGFLLTALATVSLLAMARVVLRSQGHRPASFSRAPLSSGHSPGIPSQALATVPTPLHLPLNSGTSSQVPATVQTPPLPSSTVAPRSTEGTSRSSLPSAASRLQFAKVRVRPPRRLPQGAIVPLGQGEFVTDPLQGRPLR